MSQFLMHHAQSVNIKRLTWGCHNFYCIRQNVNIKYLLGHVMNSIASEKLSIFKAIACACHDFHCIWLLCFSACIETHGWTLHISKNLSYFGLLLCPYCLGWQNKRITCKSGAPKSYPQGGWRKKKFINPNLELNNHTKTIVGSKNRSSDSWSSRIIPKRWQETKNHTSAFEEAQQPYPKDRWKQKPYFHIWTSSTTIWKR
jgi:hypothetical protein